MAHDFYTSEDLSRLVYRLRIEAGDTQAALGKALSPPATRQAISQAENPDHPKTSTLDGLKERILQHYKGLMLQRVYRLISSKAMAAKATATTKKSGKINQKTAK